MVAHRARAGLAALLTCGVVAGCGGGGGGSATTAPPPVPAPPTGVPLALSAANTLPAGTLSFGFGSVALGLGQQVVEWLEQVDAKTPPSTSCRGEGTQAVTWVDRDGSGGLNAGDQLTVSLKGCWLAMLEDVYDGSLVVDLQPVPAGVRWSARLSLGSDLVQPSADGNVRLGGQLQLEAAQDRLFKRLRMTGDTAPWTIRFEPRVASPGVLNGVETVRQLSASREIRRDTGRNTVRVELQFDSEALQGRVSAQTQTPFESWIGAVPDVGQLALTGAAGPTGLISLDPAGTAVAVLGAASAGTSSHADLSLAFLWSGAGWLALPAGERQYVLQPATAIGLRAWSTPAAGVVAPDGALEWWFSRPMRQGVGARNIFEVTRGYRWGDGQIPVDVQFEGAVVTIRPRSQLTPGTEYRLWTELDPVQLRQGDVVQPVDLFNARWTVTNAVNAAAAVQAPGAVFGAAAVQLDASGSRALDAAGITRYRWTQLSGPALSLSQPEAAQTLARSSAGATGFAMVRLEAFDARGVADRVEVVVPVLGDPATSALIKLQAPGATPLVFLSPTLSTPAPDGIQLRYLPAINALQVSTLRTPGLLAPSVTLSTAASWRAGAVIPFDTQAAPYPRAYFQTDDDCEPRAGTIRILDLAQSADGEFLRLALDVEVQCLVTGRQHRAALRWGSTVPMSW